MDVCKLLMLDIEAAVSELCHDDSGYTIGSLGIALDGCTIVGIIEDGPAFQSEKLNLGDKIVKVDEVLVTESSIISAIAGGEEEQVVIEVQKSTGRNVKVELTRVKSLDLIALHELSSQVNLAVHTCEHLQEEPESSNGRRVSDLMGILGNLTELLKRSYHKRQKASSSYLYRLRRSQERMSLNIKDLQLQMENMNTSNESQMQDAMDARDKIKQECIDLINQLQISESVLKGLESQLNNAMISIEERQRRLDEATERENSLKREIQELQVMYKQVVAGPSSMDNEVQQLKAEIKEKEEIIQGMKKDFRSNSSPTTHDGIQGFKQQPIHFHQPNTPTQNSSHINKEFGQDGTCWCKNITPEYVQHLELSTSTLEKAVETLKFETVHMSHDYNRCKRKCNSLLTERSLILKEGEEWKTKPYDSRMNRSQEMNNIRQHMHGREESKISPNPPPVQYLAGSGDSAGELSTISSQTSKVPSPSNQRVQTVKTYSSIPHVPPSQPSGYNSWHGELRVARGGQGSQQVYARNVQGWKSHADAAVLATNNFQVAYPLGAPMVHYQQQYVSVPVQVPYQQQRSMRVSARDKTTMWLRVMNSGYVE
ncbi:hypothetical protein GUITHDRAFT_134472 [Guillardia theta CCMP2712]|uniref:PDZ domain-containing protein n=1 Tax=Guillardia theta (strain CCMP2712) TaxID=905079 RepID=L1JTB3_GUITC|nr:hypothetical protein GUITHDRAFT_134472 [Guillardia theta CCMP2712]EKX51564.1 hypothetical protein GUITHDRAFT_134472 [Guillardia theta CCMP2712]|eukprot:XP_005838544.1 hypothetical protein GUITHDRAFT_134472 [Guillardia theta CCMP2712]